MITNSSFEELCTRLDEPVATWLDEIVPESVELMPNNRYSPRYAWMFSFEKRLKYRIEEVLGRPLGETERVLFGPDGVISEALSNAFVHGNHRDPALPIRVTTVVGQSSVLLRISDQGDGFDVRAVLDGLDRGAAYYHVAGNGLRALASGTGVTASFEERGRILALHVAF
jgi:hypothetical protein